jgi:hypothetical protein
MIHSVVGLISDSSLRSGIGREGVRTEDSNAGTSLFVKSMLSMLVDSTSGEGSPREFVYKRLTDHILALKRTILQT